MEWFSLADISNFCQTMTPSDARNERPEVADGAWRLYRTSLENPRPEARLLTVAIQSASVGNAIPFFAGVTAQLGKP
jgi:hypothetical protein